MDVQTLRSKFVVFPAAKKFMETDGVNEDALASAIGVIKDILPDVDFWNVKHKVSAVRFGQRLPEREKGKVMGSFRCHHKQLYISFSGSYGREKDRIYLTSNLEKNAREIRKKINGMDKTHTTSKLIGAGRIPSDYDSETTADENETELQHEREISLMPVKNTSPLNQIFYGPPGTGKTYHTIEAAVKAAEPEEYEKIVEGSGDIRKKLAEKYQKLVKEDRIRFVTFHQSYGYDEFVEGIRPVAQADSTDISYEVKSGIFKAICKAARDHEARQVLGIKDDARIWKMSIDGVNQSIVRDYCFEHGLAALGWPETGDLTVEPTEEQLTELELLGKNNRDTLNNFSNNMQEGDLVLCIGSQRIIQGIGLIAGDYKYHTGDLLAEKGYPHCRKINWLITGCLLDIYALNGETNLVQKSVYPLTRISVDGLLKEMKKQNVKFARQPVATKNYVLIIDEINRGNISKIFGELITLIEPAKRQSKSGDNQEALEVVLPYSQTPFSVPDNVFLIGTMNTADRSLALMDTALRRRFDFTEMMPDTALLANKKVSNIALDTLLEVMNKRIEVLYDREHTLGHAFFMPVVNTLGNGGDENNARAFAMLKQVFLNKIIPLLEEYFFEDWNKINLVLGGEKGSPLNFVSQKEHRYNELFGTGHGLDTYEENKITYSLAPVTDDSDCVWNQPAAYQQIYAGISNKQSADE